jgi:hypothetical protein
MLLRVAQGCSVSYLLSIFEHSPKWLSSLGHVTDVGPVWLSLELGLGCSLSGHCSPLLQSWLIVTLSFHVCNTELVCPPVEFECIFDDSRNPVTTV